MGEQISVQVIAFTSLGYIPRRGLAGPYDNFMFWGIAVPFSTASIPFSIPTSSAQGSNMCTFSLALVIFCGCFSSQINHPNGRKEVSWFWFAFPNHQWCWALCHFVGLFGHWYILLGEMSVQVFRPFLKSGFFWSSCRSSGCVPHTNPLSGMWFGRVFSQSFRLLFTVWAVALDAGMFWI